MCKAIPRVKASITLVGTSKQKTLEIKRVTHKPTVSHYGIFV